MRRLTHENRTKGIEKRAIGWIHFPSVIDELSRITHLNIIVKELFIQASISQGFLSPVSFDVHEKIDIERKKKDCSR